MSEEKRRFPIHPCDRKRFGDSVPWELLEPHRARAYKNHNQTLERLAERGGLSIYEMYSVIVGAKWDTYTQKQAEDWFMEISKNYVTKSTAGN